MLHGWDNVKKTWGYSSLSLGPDRCLWGCLCHYKTADMIKLHSHLVQTWCREPASEAPQGLKPEAIWHPERGELVLQHSGTKCLCWTGLLLQCYLYRIPLWMVQSPSSVACLSSKKASWKRQSQKTEDQIYMIDLRGSYVNMCGAALVPR